ncbi:MAG: aldo/keto reductase [Alphaproteobacteria bacterium]|nr:MAG: aldo/keto reductase [Alphaproteobacteria bacterium]
MTYRASDTRYESMEYRNSGKSGLKLPVISLGLWQNFGGNRDYPSAFEILSYAFDHGVTHFDLANNYGPPPGSAEELFGDIMARDFRPYRDEMIISSKAGYLMWPGPYGEWGTKKYVIASAEQSLKRLGLDYVDIFYSHRFDPNTPLEETMGALAQLHRQGKALYVGVSNYTPDATTKIAAILAEERIPLLIHQPRYSMLERTIEGGLLDTLAQTGSGCIVFSPLAQGLLTDKYLDGGAPAAGTRLAKARTLTSDRLTDAVLDKLRGLNAIAHERGQSLAQMAVVWVLRDPRVTSALIGARTLDQLDQLLNAVQAPTLTTAELTAIDALLG